MIDKEIKMEELELNKIHNGDALNLLKRIHTETIDMVITSPPYDSLREYDGIIWNFEIFKLIAQELKRVLKPGGVIVWVVADQTVDGSETGTSFRQALYFKEIGMNIHDTMIFKKKNYIPLTHNRYEQEFEYMFCFSKGKPKTFNPIMIKSKWGGTETWGESKMPYADNTYKIKEKTIVNEFKQKGNIFEYGVGCLENNPTEHPAVFPKQLVIDQITTWTNKGDLVLDPFMGSGTTAVACRDKERNWIGFEISARYCEMAQQRLDNQVTQLDLFGE